MSHKLDDVSHDEKSMSGQKYGVLKQQYHKVNGVKYGSVASPFILYRLKLPDKLEITSNFPSRQDELSLKTDFGKGTSSHLK